VRGRRTPAFAHTARLNPTRLVYIDPGAGSIIIQVVGSALIAVAATFSHIKRYVAKLLRRKRD